MPAPRPPRAAAPRRRPRARGALRLGCALGAAAAAAGAAGAAAAAGAGRAAFAAGTARAGRVPAALPRRPPPGAVAAAASPAGCGRRPRPRAGGGRAVRRALPLPDLGGADANLAAWFAAQLAEAPARVAEYGAWGPLYFVAAAAVAESLTFPVTPVMLTSGYIFGLQLGVAAMLASQCCAATLQFVLSRTLLRPSVEELISQDQKARSVNRAVEREGFRIMFLLRLEPLLPSSLANFAFGASSASYADFLLATLLGNVPYTLAFVSSATVLKDLFSDEAKLPTYVYVIGGLLYAGLLWAIADVAGKAITEAVEEEERGERMRGSDARPRDAAPPAPLAAASRGA